MVIHRPDSNRELRCGARSHPLRVRFCLPFRIERWGGVDRCQAQFVWARVGETVIRIGWSDHDLTGFANQLRVVDAKGRSARLDHKYLGIRMAVHTGAGA